MSTTQNIQIVGLKDLEADIKKAGFNAKPLMQAASAQAADVVQRAIRREAPVKTGVLARNVVTQVNYPTVIVAELEKYGPYVENGTRPHDIRPSKAKAVFWKGALNPYKRIHHPGTKANPFFKRGVEASKNTVMEPFIKVQEKLVKIMAGR